VSENAIKSAAAALNLDALALRALGERGISREVLARWNIGLDETRRVTIPVRGPYGFFCDMRRWDAMRVSGGGAAKNLPYERGFGQASRARWWPEIPPAGETLICEGEPDTLAALAFGANAVTVIGGAGAFGSADFSWAENRSVTYCLDRDPAGEAAVQVIRRKLEAASVGRLRQLVIPTPHKDFTDWQKGAGREVVRRALEETPWRTPDEPLDVTPVTLERITDPAIERTGVYLDGQVSAMSTQPYHIPKGVRIRCRGDAGDICLGCPNQEQGCSGIYEILPTNEKFLDVLAASGSGEKEIRSACGIPQVCDLFVDVLDRQAALPLTLIPGVQRFGRDATFVSRAAILAKDNIPPGAIARFRGYTRDHPKTKQAVTVLTDIISEIKPHENYRLPEPVGEILKSTYEGRDPYEAVIWTADLLSTHFTQTVGRRLMHAIFDLAFHSVLEFPYGASIEPGFLDVVAVGVSSTGKGRTATGLVQVYELGEILSAKRCTVAGLIGGTNRHKFGVDVVPGAWPLQHGGLCVMDEALKPDIFQHLTRARRDGLAEFTQAGVNQRMVAMVRKVWLMNPPVGKTMQNYRYGCEVLRDIAGTEEDTARWDLALCIESDVPTDKIAEASEPRKDLPKLSRELLQAKVRWAWSRKPEHIRWTPKARDRIKIETESMVADFACPPVGLVQRGNTHQKIRKFALAVAACTFSTPDFETLVVHEAHAAAAVKIMRQALAAPEMGLDALAKVYREACTVLNPTRVLAPFRGPGGAELARTMILQGMAQRRTWESMLPPGSDASGLVDSWIRDRALQERGRDLAVTRSFADLLRAEILKDGPPKRRPIRVRD